MIPGGYTLAESRIEVAGDLAIVRDGGCEFVAALEAVAGS